MKVLQPTKNKLTQGFSASHPGYDFDDVPVKEYYASFAGKVTSVINTWDKSWIANTPSDPWYPGEGKPPRALRTDDYGNFLKILGDNGVTQLVAHFPKNGIIVKPGQWVERGQVIGFAPGTENDTGNSSGGHTHTEYRNSSGTKMAVEFTTDYPIGGNMADIHIYLGVNNDQEAKTRLKEHLGEKDGKCAWGLEGNEGGYLGSARRDVRKLEDERAIICAELGLEVGTKIERIKQSIKDLITQANLPPAPPSTPNDGVPTIGGDWELVSVTIKPKTKE